jgi:hypothetical protein
MTINDFIAAVVLRTTADADLTTVNRELTFAEGDSFRIAVKDFFKDIVSGAGLNPYNAGTTYTGTYYVSYNGNMYVHVGASPSTGITPGTNPAIWEEVSIGQLAHPQNSDQYLDLNGVNEVSAADLYELLNNQTIDITSAAFEVLRAAGTLKANRYYKITDVGYVTSLFVHTSGGSDFPRTGLAVLRLPITTGQAPWIRSGSYALNDYATYRNLVYRNTTGTNTATSPDSDGVNWTPQSPTGARYESVYMIAKFSYSGGFTVTELHDTELNNTITATNLIVGSYVRRDSNNVNNISDYLSDLDASEYAGPLSNNVIISSSLSFPSGDGSGGGVNSNKLISSQINSLDDVDGEIQGNIISGTTLTLTDGLLAAADIKNSIIDLPSGSELEVRDDIVIDGVKVSSEGSTAQDTIVMSGLTVVPLNTNGYPDMYGEFVMSSTNATETVTRFTNRAHTLFPIKIAPESGLTLTITGTAHGSLASAGQVIGGAASYVLNGSKGDYVILQPITAGGFAVWKVIESSIVI